MKVITVIGARPQFIKAATLSRIFRHDLHGYKNARVDEVLVHTGQHYDNNMSHVFFQELGIPQPRYNLGVGSGSHGKMTAEMLAKIEEILGIECPDWVIVYGDTNSTLAGALAAAKLNIPVAHVEAGLRSHNRKMPEEINRKLTDHLAYLLFCPTPAAVSNLHKENITRGVHLVGDVMFDAYKYFLGRAEVGSGHFKTIAIDFQKLHFGHYPSSGKYRLYQTVQQHIDCLKCIGYESKTHYFTIASAHSQDH